MGPGRHTVRRSVVGAQGASGGFNRGGRGGGGEGVQVWKYWALRSSDFFFVIGS